MSYANYVMPEARRAPRWSLTMAWWALFSAMFWIYVAVATANAVGTFNTIIGFVHPPLGLCLFIVSGVAKSPIEKVTMQALPMIGIALALLMLIAFVPELVLFLPNLLVK